MFDYIKEYFAMGLYSKDDLTTFKTAGMISADQYDELAGVTDGVI